jgi:DNA (cytosine-5)-methyltransferase 1
MEELCKKASPYAARLRGLIEDVDDFSYPREWEDNHVTNSMLTLHEPRVVRRFASTLQGMVEQKSRFHRLHPNGLCSTLRAGTGSERGAYTSPRPIHPNKARVITVREAARLHSFPDWFRFHRTKWHGFRQVGNSVPPLLGRAIAKSILMALGLTPVRPDRSIKLGDPTLLGANHAEAARHFGLPEKREAHYRRTHGNVSRRAQVEGNVSGGSRAA